MDIDSDARIALDELDREIIRAYWLSPKASNATVARQVGTSEATIRRRLRTLIDADILQFSVVLGRSVTAGYVEIHMGVKVGGERAVETAEQISTMQQVRYVALAIGPFDILVGASLPAIDDWHDFRAEVASVPGVERTETFYITRVLKRSTNGFAPHELLGTPMEQDDGEEAAAADQPAGAGAGRGTT